MHTLKYTQNLPISVEECWSFFSSPANLKVITPENLGFELTKDTEIVKMYPGQIIGHVIQPFWNLSFNWVTEITHVYKNQYFIDEQRLGPYKFWHHEHRFNAIPHGVEMVDTIHYEMPYGFIGDLIHDFKVRKDLENVFLYRRQKVEELFGVYYA